MKIVILSIKRIINDSYLKCCGQEKGYGKNLINRIQQISNFKKNIEHAVRALKTKMKKAIQTTIDLEFKPSIEMVITYLKKAKVKSIEKERSDFDKLVIEIYGFLYSITKKMINEKIGNEYHHIWIEFNLKSELISKVNNEQKLAQILDKNKVISYIWNNNGMILQPL